MKCKFIIFKVHDSKHLLHVKTWVCPWDIWLSGFNSVSSSVSILLTRGLCILQWGENVFTEKFQEQPKRIIFPFLELISWADEWIQRCRAVERAKGNDKAVRFVDKTSYQQFREFFIQLGFLISGSFEIKITENSVEFASFHDHKQPGPFDQM